MEKSYNKDGGRDSRDSNRDSGNDFKKDKDSNRKSVRSKYRTEYSGDHVFDYKDPASLTRFISDGAKITPARISKLSIAQQKKVASAVKKARTLALLPDGADAYDTFGKAELISPAPFDY